MRRAVFVLPLLVVSALLLGSLAGSGPQPAPKAEKRFPPLRVPEGFQATLFARDPMIAYPSVIARGPRPGSLFVAADYLTGLGTGLERHDEVRLIEDTDGDGRADRMTVFATGLNSVQGLAYHDGTLYVMHSPYLSALRDTDGDGKADRRDDLLTGIGLAPEQDQIRLHNANGVVAGHDGWLYLAMGDRGCDVKRPEGDRLLHRGGAILRCRPDGRDLHVFASGLRNIYDVALDEDLNVLIRDNENDGGDYKIRVCHSFFGADHGYPYLFHERPDEALPPLADLGLGSSAGGLCYLETQFPAEYRGNLFFCEWGRAVVRAPLKRSGASFAPVKETDFASGDPTDPYGFKPTDLVVGQDGSLFISDWADGQRPRRGRGRVYCIRYVGKKGNRPTPYREKPLPDRLEDLVARLDADSPPLERGDDERCRAQRAIERRGKAGATAVSEALKKGRLGVRGRLHAVWVLSRAEGAEAVEKLLALAKADREPRVQAQAIRAIADLADPVLVRHRLDADRGDAALAARLADLAAGRDARVQLEVVVALGRLHWAGAPVWLRRNLKQPDDALAHAAMRALRQAGNWPAVLKLLDEPSSEPFRAISLRAVAGQYDPDLVDGLIARLKKETDPSRRREYADALTRVHRKPGPWTYWGFRPRPRPVNTVAWGRTGAIEKALGAALPVSDRAGRLDILRRMVREGVPAGGATLGRWLGQERDPDTVAVLLGALRGPATDGPGLSRSASRWLSTLEAILPDRKQTTGNRLLAVSLFLDGLDEKTEGRLPVVAEGVEDGPVLAELLRAIGTRKVRGGSKLLLGKLSSKDTDVRASAVAALAALGKSDAREPIGRLLADPQARVRSAAALAVGRLGARDAAGRLLNLARDPDAGVRRSSLEALRQLREARALPVAVKALDDGETAVKALECVGDLGGAEQAAVVAGAARRRPSAEVLNAAGKVLVRWASRKDLPAARRQQVEQALAAIHGGSGTLLGWRVRGPMQPSLATGLARAVASGKVNPSDDPSNWPFHLSVGLDARLRLGAARTPKDTWLAYSELSSDEPLRVEFFTTGSGPSTVWLNGKQVYQRDRPGVPGPYPERFEASLQKGTNRLLVSLTAGKGEGEFQLRFRRKNATAIQERLALAALSRAGNPAAGRTLFLNAEKSLCIRCHRVGDVGERVGPELTGLGSRFPKVYIVESILEPARTISPSFESTLVELKNGRLVVGIKVAETEKAITLIDNETKKHVLARADIADLRKAPGSAMPDGLEKRLTEDEFVDLVSFLVNLKEKRGR
jgi:putative membrane-bound dehydrogenase-like protein